MSENLEQDLLDFSQLVVKKALNNESGLIPLFSQQYLFQKRAYEFLIRYCQFHYSGFVALKNNLFPYDSFKDLEGFLKPNTIIFINQISNSHQFAEVLELSKNHLIIAGFECFCSPLNPLDDFLQRFQMVSHIDFATINIHVSFALFIHGVLKNEYDSSQYNNKEKHHISHKLLLNI